MYLDNAVFECFRNIIHHPFIFTKGVNIFYGKNAQGKTNVLEGLYLFAGGKSFRHAREKDLIYFDAPHTQVSICYVTEEREVKMSVRYFRDFKKQMFKNGVKLNKTSDFIGNFKAVLFCPDHLGLVKNEPSVRRSFIDGAISQLSPLYLSYLMEYTKVIEQRNALLKKYSEYGTSFDMTFSILSEKAAKLAGALTAIRSRYINELSKFSNICLEDMTVGYEEVKLDYITNISTRAGEPLFDAPENEKKYKKLFFENVEKEKIMGTTLFGAHRDDFEIRLNDKSAKLYCSQGQQRSIALAMKLAEGEISRVRTGETPVFLFDDVLSELDADRKHYILSKLRDRQVIITSCSEDDFITEKAHDAQKIYVENGEFFYR